MLVNLITLIVLLVLMIGFGWLVWRAWHARRALVKWPGVVLSSLVTILLGAVTVTGSFGFAKFYLAAAPPVPDLRAAGSAEQVARGEHLAQVFCAECHGVDWQLPLSGGKDISAEFGMPLGTVVTANLTPGGRISSWTDGEIIRVLRAGRDKDGRSLLIMRSGSVIYGNLSDEDALSLVAYLQSQPAVEHETPAEQPSLLALIFVATGLLPQPDAQPVAGPIIAPPKDATATYGEYLVNASGCRDCHGTELDGTAGGLAPAAPNLRAIVPQWTVEQFTATLRTGIDPGGHQLSDEMPWRGFGKFDDVELAAVYAYITGLPALEAAD